MRIEGKKLNKFFDKVSIGKSIKTAVLNFTEEGLSVKVVDITNITTSCGLLKRTDFQEYEVAGELGIKDINVFTKMVNRHNVVQLSVENNKLKIIGETGFAYNVLCDKGFVENNLEKEIVLDKADDGFRINSDDLKNIKSAGEDLGVKEVVLEVKDKKLSLTVTNESGDSIVEERPCDYKDCKCKYGEFLYRVFNVIEGEVTISFSNDYPILITEASESYVIKYIVAPMISD